MYSTFRQTVFFVRVVILGRQGKILRHCRLRRLFEKDDVFQTGTISSKHTFNYCDPASGWEHVPVPFRAHFSSFRRPDQRFRSGHSGNLFRIALGHRFHRDGLRNRFAADLSGEEVGK